MEELACKRNSLDAICASGFFALELDFLASDAFHAI